MRKLFFFFFLSLFSYRSIAQKLKEDSAFILKNYDKIEQMIPMRDGVALYTAIYVPKDATEKHPILLNRTPYSCAPYGKTFRAFWYSYHMKYCHEKYIMVFQDVRGRFMSEGDFEDVRPFIPNKTGNVTDEASDTYDTIDWLLNNLKQNNGNVGVFGISYPGFYSTMAALSGHPALKAVSPQAPVTDWFIGDDFHHNGAFMLMDAFDFYSGFGVPRPYATKNYNSGYSIKSKNKYKFYLDAGPLPNFNKKYLGDSIRFWNDLMTHPVYDSYWKNRNTRNFVQDIKPAMLIVGGLFDAEDLFGAWNLYKDIEEKNPATHYNKIIMGPWFHGAWEGRSPGDKLGKIKFGSNTSSYYQDSLEFPFFQHFLKGAGAKDQVPEASVFVSGENKWKNLQQWPPAGMKPTPLYLRAGGSLSFTKPNNQSSDSIAEFTQYTSDPMKPVPYEGNSVIRSRGREYMTADQRFAHHRKDVVTFSTPALEHDITLAGPLGAELLISISTTDADFIVKLVDLFPADISNTKTGADTIYRKQTSMNNYEMLVRGDIMRGKFRNSYEKPEPFVPGEPTKVAFVLPDVSHTFLKGHKIMVQIQSSWFPLADRNPQIFTDIYQATQNDFRKASIKIYHNEDNASKITLPIIVY